MIVAVAKKTNTTGTTQEELDREDERLRVEKTVKKYLDSVATFCDKNERFAKLKPEQIAFVLMMLEPKDTRMTFDEMAKALAVHDATLYRWQNDELVIDLRVSLMKMIFKKFTPDIMLNIATTAQMSAAVANPVPAATLWLKYIEEFKDSFKADLEMPAITFGFPGGSQFIKPVDAQDPKESLAQKHTKDVKVMLGKKNMKKKSVVAASRK